MKVALLPIVNCSYILYKLTSVLIYYIIIFILTFKTIILYLDRYLLFFFLNLVPFIRYISTVLSYCA